MLKKKRLYINEDNAHFYIKHPAEDMSVEGLNNLVDTYNKCNSLQGIFFNINVQRALFDSREWEAIYHDYNPENGAEQPCLQWLPPEKRELHLNCHGRNWIHNLWLLKERNIDHFAVWLERCRHHNVEGWLSIRMNDCHHNDSEDAFWHPAFWRNHPEYRRIQYYDEGWFEGAFDFEFTEVVEHHMKLIEEACERWDMYGVELDWVRWVRHFKPGSEEKNSYILTDIMRRTRQLTEKASKRLGHPVKLAVRLPQELQSCVGFGYDLPTWADEKLCDLITLAPFFNQPFYDWQVRLWQSVFGKDVQILCQPEHFCHASPVSVGGGAVNDYYLHFGSCASALQRGADGIYLFNDCYREGVTDDMRKVYPNILEDLLEVAPDLEKLRNFKRRQAVSYPQVCGPGMATGAVLPIALAKPDGAYDFGRFREVITLRIPLGPKPTTALSTLVLGVDTNVNEGDFKVWINGLELNLETLIDISELKLPDVVKSALSWNIPLEMLQDDTNIVEILPPQVAGNLVWAEIAINYNQK